MTRALASSKRSPGHLALLVAMAYLIIGGTWILLSDRLLSFLIDGDIERMARLQTYKGWGFVAATGLVLYAAIRSILRIVRRAERDLKAAKEAAEAANGAKDRFLAALSHELRTPLTPVLAAVSAMERDRDCTEAHGADLERIRRNAEHEARLIDNLLDLTHLGSARLELDRKRVDAHELIRSALAMCGGEIESKRLDLTASLEAASHHVLADSGRLLRAFWNLIQNAARFTPAGGNVAVTSSNGSGVLRIDVADSGIGMDAATLARLFDALESRPRLAGPQAGGLGFGLTIAKAIVTLHGGTLCAASRGAGLGAVFTVQLPTVPAPAEEAPSADVPENGAPMNILLVEDNADTARVLARLLRSSSHRVKVADRVEVALKMAREERFDLLISDIGLPDGTGIDLMRRVRSERPIRGIAISGYGMDEDVRRSKEAGFAEHLVKPINYESLEQAIVRTIRGEHRGETRRT